LFLINHPAINPPRPDIILKFLAHNVKNFLISHLNGLLKNDKRILNLYLSAIKTICTITL